MIALVMFVLGFIFCSFILGTIFYFHNRAQNRENSSLQERLHHLEGQFQMMQPPLAQGGGALGEDRWMEMTDTNPGRKRFETILS